MKLFIVIVMLGMFCAGCELIKVEGPKKETTASASPSSTPAQTAFEPSTRPGAQPTPFGKVTRDEFGNDWPLTVAEGVLRCEPEPNGTQSVFFLTNGQIYAVNGTAIAKKNAKKIDEIWASNPAVPGTKKNIGKLIEKGLSLCGK